MPDRRIGLDNPAFQGRLKRPPRTSSIPSPGRRMINDYAAPKPLPRLSPVPPPVEQTKPVMKAPLSLEPKQSPLSRQKRFSRPQLAVLSLAAILLVIGLGVSFQGFRANRTVAAQAVNLNKKSQSRDDGAPSTVKPSTAAVRQYVVAPDLPRYLKIPKLGVFARVTQAGVTPSGALGTPRNVYDTAWYTGSAKPGQAGATLIDGHVSSWTTRGVFYGLKKLAPGDNLQIVRGDGVSVNYKVVKTQVYASSNVDMQAAVTPVTAGNSGLNLITCTGKLQKGTDQFNQRLIVFAEEE